MSPTTNTDTAALEAERQRVTEQLDELITEIVECKCGHEPESLKHFEAAVRTFGIAMLIEPELIVAALAVAVGRLAAARKAGTL